MRKFHFILMAVFIALGSLTSVSATGNCQCDHACDSPIPDIPEQEVKCKDRYEHDQVKFLFSKCPDVKRSLQDRWVGCNLEIFIGDCDGKTFDVSCFEQFCLEIRLLFSKIDKGTRDCRVFMVKRKVDPRFTQNDDTCAAVYRVCCLESDNSVTETDVWVTLRCRRFTFPCVRLDANRALSMAKEARLLCILYQHLVTNTHDGIVFLQDCKRYLSECDVPALDPDAPFVANARYQMFKDCAVKAFPGVGIERAFLLSIATSFLKCEIVKEDDYSVCVRYFYDINRAPLGICPEDLEGCDEFTIEISKKRKDDCEMVKQCVRERVEEGCTRIDSVIVQLQEEITYLKDSILDCLDGEEGNEFQV